MLCQEKNEGGEEMDDKDTELKEEFLRIYPEERNIERTIGRMGLARNVVKKWANEDNVWAARKKTVIKETKAESINKIRKETNSMGAMIKTRKNSKVKRQEVFLREFRKGNFHIHKACDRAGIPRGTYNAWRFNDEEFVGKLREAIEEKKDNIEEQLYNNVKDGDSSCIIFACKTQLKDRGYVERQEVEHTGQFGVMVAPGRIEDMHEWASKALNQQRLLKEKGMETEYIREIGE